MIPGRKNLKNGTLWKLLRQKDEHIYGGKQTNKQGDLCQLLRVVEDETILSVHHELRQGREGHGSHRQLTAKHVNNLQKIAFDSVKNMDLTFIGRSSPLEEV